MVCKFTGSFTQQQALPAAAVDAAVAVLNTGRLHRYNLAEGELGEVAMLEAAYREWQGSAFCLAVTSGGQALQIAMRACGVTPDTPVLTNAFTLAPVPGAIAAVGGNPVLVEIDETLRLDLTDLDQKIDTSGAKVLLVSHMRGHLSDMERLMQICDDRDVVVIEDCAHTMGATWNGKRSGNFSAMACFSTQTYKHMNSGEGGLLTTDDADLAARATILSGSYMLYGRHGAGPDDVAFAEAQLDMPNCSARMDALRAAVLRPQLAQLDQSITRWNRRYRIVEDGLCDAPHISLIKRPVAEQPVGSSIQFRLPAFTAAQCQTVLTTASERGVDLKWFGGSEPSGFTSSHGTWCYIPAQALPATDSVLSTLFDMRLSLTFSEADCALIARIIRDVVDEVAT